MKFHKTSIEGVVIVEPTVFEDSRGLFFECYNKALFAKNGICPEFVQDNQSTSVKGTLRGLHYQAAPAQQAKLVRVVRGSAFDVVVDLRKSSKTFGRHLTHTLSAENRLMIYVPEGFAHGFLALTDETHFFYKVSGPHSLAHERGVPWDDPTIGVQWPRLDKPYLISNKDRSHPSFKDAEVFP